jgi:hypothetical protein
MLEVGHGELLYLVRVFSAGLAGVNFNNMQIATTTNLRAMTTNMQLHGNRAIPMQQTTMRVRSSNHIRQHKYR